jgi:hypothetical protein
MYTKTSLILYEDETHVPQGEQLLKEQLVSGEELDGLRWKRSMKKHAPVDQDEGLLFSDIG